MTREEFKAKLARYLNKLPCLLQRIIEYEIDKYAFTDHFDANLQTIESNMLSNDFECQMSVLIDYSFTWMTSKSLPDYLTGTEKARVWRSVHEHLNHHYIDSNTPLYLQGIKLQKYVREEYPEIYDHWTSLLKVYDEESLKMKIKHLKKVIES